MKTERRQGSAQTVTNAFSENGNILTILFNL